MSASDFIAGLFTERFILNGNQQNGSAPTNKAEVRELTPNDVAKKLYFYLKGKFEPAEPKYPSFFDLIPKKSTYEKFKELYDYELHLNCSTAHAADLIRAQYIKLSFHTVLNTEESWKIMDLEYESSDFEEIYSFIIYTIDKTLRNFFHEDLSKKSLKDKIKAYKFFITCAKNNLNHMNVSLDFQKLLQEIDDYRVWNIHTIHEIIKVSTITEVPVQ